LITIGGYTRASGAPSWARIRSPPWVSWTRCRRHHLTAIVISFAVGALTLIICYRVYLDHGTDDPQGLPTEDEHDTADGFAP